MVTSGPGSVAAALCAVLFCTLTGGQEASQPTVGTLGSTQIYQPPPTDSTISCIYFNSLTNRTRVCSEAGACFSYIRRRSDGTFRVKRGCSAECQEDDRARKIQRCCTTSMCNTHVLSEANFTSNQTPPPQCYRSISNSTCDLTTACYSRLTYQSDGSYQLRQGCIRGPECVEQSDNRIIQRCCTSHLCNTPITSRPPIQTTPTPTPTFPLPIPSSSVMSDAPPTLSSWKPPQLIPDPSTSGSPSFHSCHCSHCPQNICLGMACGSVITYTTRPHPLINYTCVSDITACQEAIDPTPNPGTTTVICCFSNLCNTELALPPLPVTTPTVPSTHATVTTTLLTPSDSTEPVTTAMPQPRSHTPDSLPFTTENIYFIFTAVVSVIGGVIVICVILGVLVALVLHIRKKHKSILHRSPRQLSPDCHVTACYPLETKDSPIASTSSSSTNSGEFPLSTELLKKLGTSV